MAGREGEGEGEGEGGEGYRWRKGEERGRWSAMHMHVCTPLRDAHLPILKIEPLAVLAGHAAGCLGAEKGKELVVSGGGRSGGYVGRGRWGGAGGEGRMKCRE